MVFPDQNLGIAGFSIDEQDLFQVATDLHARPIRETSLKEGKTVKYSVPTSQLDGSGPYELSIPSMDMQWLDPESGQLFGVFKIVKVPVVAVESVGVDKSVQFTLSPEPCNLKVLAWALDKDQFTKSKLIPFSNNCFGVVRILKRKKCWSLK